MPKITVNPNAKMPVFVAVTAGEYGMRVERLQEKTIGQNEKGNWWARMRLVHTAPANSLVSVQGRPLGDQETPGSVSAVFMLDERGQGKVRQAFEAAGVAWPTDAPEFDSEESYAEWIFQTLEGRELVVRLKTVKSKDGDEWQNEVARYIVAA